MIDIQNDYFDGGRNPLVHAGRAAERAAKALTCFRENHLPVFHVQHISNHEGATFFLPDTAGSRIHQSVSPLPGEPVIIKHAPDCFFQTDLRERFLALGVKQVYICGMMSHMCIDTSVRSAERLGFSVRLVEDACATKDLVWNGETIPAETVHKAFMASLQGVFAEIIRLEDIEDIHNDGIMSLRE